MSATNAEIQAPARATLVKEPRTLWYDGIGQCHFIPAILLGSGPKPTLESGVVGVLLFINNPRLSGLQLI